MLIFVVRDNYFSDIGVRDQKRMETTGLRHKRLHSYLQHDLLQVQITHFMVDLSVSLGPVTENSLQKVL
jgi:hypothetical protein